MQCIYTHVYSLCGRTTPDKIRLNFENYTKDVYDFSYVSHSNNQAFQFCPFYQLLIKFKISSDQEMKTILDKMDFCEFVSCTKIEIIN